MKNKFWKKLFHSYPKRRKRKKKSNIQEGSFYNLMDFLGPIEQRLQYFHTQLSIFDYERVTYEWNQLGCLIEKVSKVGRARKPIRIPVVCVVFSTTKADTNTHT